LVVILVQPRFDVDASSEFDLYHFIGGVAAIDERIETYAGSMSLVGQTLPSHSAQVRINVCYSPQATKSRTSCE